MGAEIGGWEGIDAVESVTPEQLRRLQDKREVIESEETEAIRAALSTAAGQRMLDLLHTRYVDQDRFEPDEPNPVYKGFWNEGRASIVRMMEAKSRPFQGE
ncbi:hypothetical protein LCGC14_1361250 [marine sediment metagenome]|uniref:Uncharacterized protein n=1 Tax=marine sediment metagenome TaxID=412755 RepID=A0A0F9MNI7_9ZZZZ